MHVPNLNFHENSTTKFLAVCCQSAGKTGNLRVLRKGKAFDFDFKMFAFDSTKSPCTQVVASHGFDGLILAFNAGGKSIFWYDYRTESRKPGRQGEVLVGKLENTKSLTIIKEIDPYIWLVHLGKEQTFAVFNLACGVLSKCRISGLD